MKEIRVALFPSYMTTAQLEEQSPQLMAVLARYDLRLVDYGVDWRGDPHNLPHQPILVRASTTLPGPTDETFRAKCRRLVKSCVGVGHFVFYNDQVVSERGALCLPFQTASLLEAWLIKAGYLTAEQAVTCNPRHNQGRS